MNIGQTEIATLVTVGQAFVVDTQAVQDGCVQVMDMGGFLGDVVAEIVCFAVNHSRLNTPTGHPFRVATRMVVAPIIGFRQFSSRALENE